MKPFSQSTETERKKKQNILRIFWVIQSTLFISIVLLFTPLLCLPFLRISPCRQTDDWSFQVSRVHGVGAPVPLIFSWSSRRVRRQNTDVHSHASCLINDDSWNPESWPLTENATLQSSSEEVQDSGNVAPLKFKRWHIEILFGLVLGSLPWMNISVVTRDTIVPRIAGSQFSRGIILFVLLFENVHQVLRILGLRTSLSWSFCVQHSDYANPMCTVHTVQMFLECKCLRGSLVCYTYSSL